MRTFTIKLLGVIRYLRPDRNPLRRPVDRTHARLMIALGVLVLVLAPLAVIVTARVAGGAGVRAQPRPPPPPPQSGRRRDRRLAHRFARGTRPGRTDRLARHGRDPAQCRRPPRGQKAGRHARPALDRYS